MLVLIGVFIFSALTSPLFTYYAGDIIGNLSGSNDAKLILPDPHWHELIASYFKNSSQLVMLICAYLVADMCAFGKDKSLQHFYKSRGENAWIVFWPKVLVSVAITFIGTVVGVFLLHMKPGSSLMIWILKTLLLCICTSNIWVFTLRNC
ncbi:hypothetical protein O7R04_03920 [Bacillus velezensis]|uniref:hypothetical protein n=1 Tax=Bacillus velezensis TaxID=492670 RepID=UPI0022DE8916|nr:hypothetical protein [Bacillus velezensis]WBL40061.1 hypothetical protein O7R04_03920 [Bacillus velezensis]